MQFIVGVYDEEGPPVPIPNTVVKLFSAENTWRAAARENRSTLTSSSSHTLLSMAFFLFKIHLPKFYNLLSTYPQKSVMMNISEVTDIYFLRGSVYG